MNRFTLLLPLFAACAISDESVDESTAEHELGQILKNRLSCGANATCDFDLAPSTHTCVLMGINGGLGSSPNPVSIAIEYDASGASLHVDNVGNAQQLMVSTVCWNQPLREHAVWHSGDAPTFIAGGGNGSKRCFLSGITNGNSIAFNGTSYTSVNRVGIGDHEISGSFPAGSDVTVEATCTTVAFQSQHIDTGPLTAEFLVVDDGLTACAMAGFGGVVNATGRGARTYALNGRWYSALTNGTTLDATCFK